MSIGDAHVGNHTNGGILVGGNFEKTGTGNYAQNSPVSSYVAGKVDTWNSYGGDSSAENTTHPLYVGASKNKVTVSFENDSSSSYRYKLNERDGSPKNSAHILEANYSYADFTKISQVATTTLDVYRKKAQPAVKNESGKIVIQAGSNVFISADLLNGNPNIDIVGTSSNNTIITVQGDTAVISQELIDGQQPATVENSQSGTSIVWYFPEATSVSLPTQNWMGHVVAPKGTITQGSGNYSGTLLGQSINIGSEGHCYPYRGTGFETAAGLALKVTKKLSGKELVGGEFSFKVYDESGNPVKVDNSEVTGTNAADGTVTFAPAFRYTLEDMKKAGSAEYESTKAFTYTVKEDIPKDAREVEKGVFVKDGITYDSSEKKVTVTVTYNAGTGTLSVEQTTVPDSAEATFTNKYTSDAEVTLSGRKVLENAGLQAGTFTFGVYDGNGNPIKAVDADGKLVEVTGTNAADGTIRFTPALKFTLDDMKKAGSEEYESEKTFTYKVKEIIPADAVKAGSLFVKDGIVYDNTEKETKVTVTYDDEEGLMKAALVAAEPTFTNTAATGTLSLEAFKSMKDARTALGTFEFEVRDAAGNLVAEAKNDSTGKIVFANIAKFTLEDVGKTFSYKVKEKIPQTQDNIIYDGAEYTVTVAVADKGDGTLDAKVSSISKDGAPAESVQFVNDVTHMSIKKLDETGAPLAGARLVVKDAAGNAVDTWTTDGNAHDITGLARGKYTLSEIEAPSGYQVSADIPFEITGQETSLELTMTDKKIPASDNRSLTVTKHLRLDGITSDLGVREATYYVALFSDEAKTQRVSNVKKIEFKNQTSSSVTFDNLANNTTYYVGETDENGNLLVSKKVNDRVIFYPEYDGSAVVAFEGRKLSATSEFTNVYVELEPGFYLAGQLTVTKKVLIGGEEGFTDDTFYARVFSNAALTKPASDVLTLAMNGNSTTSVTVTDLPIGETLDSSAKYFVAETDENGTPLNPDEITEYEISIDNSKVVLSANNSEQEVVITNDFVEEEESEVETEVDEKKTAPKTGDDTDFMRYLLLMAFSFGLFTVAVGQKRSKKREEE